MTWIDDQFPKAKGKYQKTSDCSQDYNCIAWAAGDDTAKWMYCPGYRWPGGRRKPMIECLVEVFTYLGYEICDSGELESGYDKVALYERNGMYKHAARQLADGSWTSKLGDEEDICHDDAECLTETIYGKIHCYMRRPRSA